MGTTAKSRSEAAKKAAATRKRKADEEAKAAAASNDSSSNGGNNGSDDSAAVAVEQREVQGTEEYRPTRQTLKNAGLDQHAAEEKRQKELAEERKRHNERTGDPSLPTGFKY